VIIGKSDEGGYNAIVPVVPDCGQYQRVALVNIREAIELYLEPND